MITGVDGIMTPNSDKRCQIQAMVIEAESRYSTYVEDLVIDFCFLKHYETGLSLKYMIYTMLEG